MQPLLWRYWSAKPLAHGLLPRGRGHRCQSSGSTGRTWKAGRRIKTRWDCGEEPTRLQLAGYEALGITIRSGP